MPEVSPTLKQKYSDTIKNNKSKTRIPFGSLVEMGIIEPGMQIFDQNGNFLDEWYQFSRLSGIFIDDNDILYGVDSESNASRGRADWRRGIRVGSARTGEVSYFIPDPFDANNGPYSASSGGEGVVADKDGVIYSAEVGPRSVKRYVRFEN